VPRVAEKVQAQGTKKWGSLARGSCCSPARHPQFQPPSFCFRDQQFEVHKFEAVCRALASVQKTLQNPEKISIIDYVVVHLF